MIGLTADAGEKFKNRASIPLAPCSLHYLSSTSILLLPPSIPLTLLLKSIDLGTSNATSLFHALPMLAKPTIMATSLPSLRVFLFLCRRYGLYWLAGGGGGGVGWWGVEPYILRQQQSMFFFTHSFSIKSTLLSAIRGPAFFLSFRLHTCKRVSIHCMWCNISAVVFILCNFFLHALIKKRK
jgi:hypothetical protein